MATSEANPCDKCNSKNVERKDICHSVADMEDPDNIVWVMKCGDCGHRYLDWYMHRLQEGEEI